MDFLGFGWGEILIILFVAFMVLGPKRIIEIGRTLGKMVRAFKKEMDNLNTQISTELDASKKEIPQIKTEPEIKRDAGN